MVKRILKYSIAIALCAVIAAGSLQAASFTFTGQAKRIKAGVVLTIGSSLIPADRPDPYVFYIMDQRQDIKPSGWEFYNPFASSHVTQDIYTRWIIGTTPCYTLGQTLDKSMGGYWEVNLLEVSPENLAEYDVLLLTGYQLLTFDGRQREKLRKFVDNGGVLWVDHQQKGGAQTRIDTSMFMVNEVNFSDVTTAVGAVIDPTASAHALMNRPFALTPTDVNFLGGAGGPLLVGKEYITLAANALGVFSPIVMRDTNPVVCAAPYGSGYIVLTADGVAQAITSAVGQINGQCGTMFLAAQPEDLKLAYNIVNWGSEYSTYLKNPRHTGYSFAEIGSPLVKLWSYDILPAVAAKTDASAAVLDDIVFYVDGNNPSDNILHAFDLSPIRDRDADGNPDDGLPDYATGAPYDELWHVHIPERCSSPTAAYAPLNGIASSPVPTVFVVTESGKVKGFKALQYSAAGVPPTAIEFFTASGQTLDPFTALMDIPIPAPTYADGALYVGDGKGALHGHDFFATTTNEWCHPLQLNRPQLGSPCSPTVGYIHDPVTGATELAVYIATHGVSGTDGAIRSYPMKSFNETLGLVDAIKGQWRVRSINTYIDTTKLPHLYYIDGAGGTHDILCDPSWVSNPGNFLIPSPDKDPLLTNDYYALLADYELQYLQEVTTAMAGANSATLIPPPPYRSIPTWHPNYTAGATTEAKGITGSPVAAKNDVLYFGTENGSMYAVKESGRSTAAVGHMATPLVVKWRWHLGDPLVSTLLGLSTASKIIGSPVVIGDMVYYTINDGAQGYLLAFKADPTFSIKLNQPIMPDTAVTVQQHDTIQNADKQFSATADTDVDQTTANSTSLIDYNTGKLTFINFRPRNGNGELTASADLIVSYFPDTPAARQGGQPVLIQEPHSAFAANWNNLVWFMKLQAPGLGTLTATSSPSAMGNILYIGCGPVGVLCAIDVDKAGGKASGTGVSLVPFDTTPATGYAWAILLSTLPITAPLSGSHGMLTVATADGLTIMYNPVTMIADSNRLVEVSAKGTPVWSCDSTNGFSSTWAVASGSGPTDHMVHGAVNVPFNRPTVARRASVGGILVADTGNNRIVHMDRGGTASWQIKDFVELDTNHPILPPGSPMELNKPTDVTCWQTMEPQDPADLSSALRPAYHYLIADSGNHRVLEVAARYDMSANQYRNVIVRVSDSLAGGRQLRYTTARIAAYGADGSGRTGIKYIICAAQNEDSTGQSGSAPGGTLVTIDWMPSVVPDDMTGHVVGVVRGLPVILPGAPLPASGTPTLSLVNPTFYNRQYVSSTEYADVVIDAVGIHVCHVMGGVVQSIRTYRLTDHVDIDETSLAPGTPLLTPAIPGGLAHHRPLSPSYAQYLPNGNVLVTNRATGIEVCPPLIPPAVLGANPMWTKRAFFGETFEIEIDPNDVTKYRRVPGTSVGFSAGLHQPLSAERAIF